MRLLGASALLNITSYITLDTMSRFHEQKKKHSLLWPIATVQFHSMPDSWCSQDLWHTKYNPGQLVLAAAIATNNTFWLVVWKKQEWLTYLILFIEIAFHETQICNYYNNFPFVNWHMISGNAKQQFGHFYYNINVHVFLHSFPIAIFKEKGNSV